MSIKLSSGFCFVLFCFLKKVSIVDSLHDGKGSKERQGTRRVFGDIVNALFLDLGTSYIGRFTLKIHRATHLKPAHFSICINQFLKGLLRENVIFPTHSSKHQSFCF